MTDKEARQIFSRKIRNFLQEADGIVAVSQFTQQQLMERFVLDREKIKVIHHGINLKEWETYKQESLERTKASLSLPSDFLLFVGAHEPRKNLPNLLRALRMVHDRYQKIPLVLVGRKGLDTDNIREIILQLGLDSWVKLVGYLEEKELKNIYRLASAFVFPSLWEGFGIPLLEAMASNLPIITSRSAALPEIAQEAAVYTDPDDPGDMATKIIHVLEDPSLQNRLISVGEKRVALFSWERAALDTLNFYHSVMTR
jgi:glycosyltransferase involved in cell wall biosynthesis